MSTSAGQPLLLILYEMNKSKTHYNAVSHNTSVPIALFINILFNKAYIIKTQHLFNKDFIIKIYSVPL